MSLFPTFGFPTRHKVASWPAAGVGSDPPAARAGGAVGGLAEGASIAVASSVMAVDPFTPLDRAADAVETESKDGEPVALGQEVVIGAGRILQSLDLGRDELDHVAAAVAHHV